MEEHISVLSDHFQKLTDLGDTISNSWSVGMLLSSLPLSYNTLIVALETRPEADLTLSLVQEKLITEYYRRNEQENQCDEALLKISNEKVCFFCKKSGHIKKYCRKFKQWISENESKANEDKAKMVGQNEDDYLFMVSPKRSSNWVIDSGATSHIANDKTVFVTLNAIEHYLTIADGRKVRVRGKGTCRIELVNEKGDKKTALVADVLYIPEIEGNLLSVKKLIDKDYEVQFKKDKCEIRKDEKQIAIMDVSNLFTLRAMAVKEHNSNCIHNLHRIFGHRDPEAIREMNSKGLVKMIDCGIKQQCEVCLMAKSTRLSFPNR